MQRGPGQNAQRPFPGKGRDAKEQIDDLKDGDGFDGPVEVLGGKVPEDFWPEEALEGGEDLIWAGVSTG